VHDITALSRCVWRCPPMMMVYRLLRRTSTFRRITSPTHHLAFISTFTCIACPSSRYTFNLALVN